ncbi:MAG: TIGR00300 family protein [Armatimonadetes bacterium]|nr:TIGR00300 family protein [Armatimonadota bacterium]
MPVETVSLDGHIIDSLTLSKVLDLILLGGGSYRIQAFQVGVTRDEPSHAEIEVRADTSERLDAILARLGQQGAARQGGEAECRPAPADGVFPEGFYATTNLETQVRVEGRWLPVARLEMDCCIVIRPGPEAACTPFNRVRRGDAVVVGDGGVRVEPLPRREPGDAFAFMGSDVSTERPKGLLVARVADALREAHSAGRKVLFVGGPAIVHTGAAPCLAALLAGGWIDVLFAGNALATHDIELALFGTSLGVDVSTGLPTAHGHEHHLRAINAIRAAGGIRPAVADGLLRSGVMHACVTHGVRYVLAGSIRDDGPLPDVITDVIEAQEAMRAELDGVGVALMVATTLHSVATGNLLPAAVRTICVDADADTVIKLLDRGTHQAVGLVTDCEFFLRELARGLEAGG